MSEDPSSSPVSGPPTNRSSFDDSVDLNNDLANGSEYSVSSGISHPNQNIHRRSGSLMFRNSIDAESTFSSSPGFNISNNQSEDFFSPLGPNSIYELTIASDLARTNKSRRPKTSVTINGGMTTITNLRNPSTKDIPQIQLSKLKKKVNNTDLESSYIKNIMDEYKSFESSYKRLTEDTLQKFVEQSRKQNKDGSLSSNSSVDNFKEITFQEDVEDISSVPSVYSNVDFRLDDPRIFKQVLGEADIFQDDPNAKAQSTELQNKLSQYLDIVEVNLIKEISKSSESFFNTLGDIDVIKSQSAVCVEQFQNISDKLKVLELEHSQTGLNILNNLIKKKEVEQLESSLLQLHYIVSIAEVANKSFHESNYSKCLNEIIVVENMINGIECDQILSDGDLYNDIKDIYPKLNYPLVDLTHLPALVNLRNDLHNLKSDCSRGYINDFVELLLSDLRDHYNNIPVQDTLNRMYVSIDKTKRYASKPINRSFQSIGDKLKTKMSEFITDLIKSGHLTRAYSYYQERIITEIKNIIKVNLPTNPSNSVQSSNNTSRSSSVPPESSGSHPGANGSSNTLSSNIKSLTPKEFETVLTKTYASLSECLRRLTAHQKVLLDLALTSVPQAMASSIDIMSLDITSCIHKSIELSQIRITKIINVRSEQTADLPVSFYLRLYSITSAYLQECELINPGFNSSGSGSASSLSEWFKHHVNYFVHRFHSNALRSLVADCDKEIWKELTQMDALEECQIIINHLVGYSVYVSGNRKSGFSGDTWLSALDFYDDSQKSSSTETPLPTDFNKVFIDDEKFLIPDLVRKSLKQIEDYIIISKVFPGTTSLIENNLLNYFKLMNSKTSQAVLNAGATRTAGLKHITTRHLALCIQLVEFNILLLENIQNIFPDAQKQREDSPSNQSEELTFTRIISNYKDHENELFSKFVSIMYDKTTRHCQAIVALDLSEPIKHPKQCHPYMETLVKDTLTVSNVLFKYLPDLKGQLILSQVFDNYKKLLVECFCTQLPQFKDFNEKHSLLKDIDYFRVKLSEVPGYGNSGQVIWENVNSLPTVEDTKMEEVMRNNIQGEKELKSKTSSRAASVELANEKEGSAVPAKSTEEPAQDSTQKAIKTETTEMDEVSGKSSEQSTENNTEANKSLETVDVVAQDKKDSGDTIGTDNPTEVVEAERKTKEIPAEANEEKETAQSNGTRENPSSETLPNANANEASPPSEDTARSDTVGAPEAEPKENNEKEAPLKSVKKDSNTPSETESAAPKDESTSDIKPEGDKDPEKTSPK